MKVNDNGGSIEKNTPPRDGWENNICSVAARLEAENMTKEFTHLDSESLDEGENGDIW